VVYNIPELFSERERETERERERDRERENIIIMGY
jgi:hypothetical protein